MRVGFDLTPLARPCPPGIQRVVRESLAALEARGRIEVVRLAPPATGSLRRWRERELAAAVRREGLVGLHSFLSAFALRGPGRRVQTLHELPWRHGVRENADLSHRLWAGLLSRRADAVITASERVATELGRKRAEAGGKLHVVPWGVSTRFQPEPPLGAIDELVLDRYRFPEGPFALCLGAVRRKKNLRALIAGLARLRERGGRPPQLVVTGPDTPDLRADLAHASRAGLTRYLSTPGMVEEEDLPALLRLASLVPVLSASEGFGLPVLEALASGTPVLVPRASVQAEVAGEHALLVEPADPDSVARGIAEALERREELRPLLAARAREFPWERTAAGIEAVWEGLAR